MKTRFADMDIEDELESRKRHELLVLQFVHDAGIIPPDRWGSLYDRRFPKSPADIREKILAGCRKAYARVPATDPAPATTPPAIPKKRAYKPFPISTQNEVAKLWRSYTKHQNGKSPLGRDFLDLHKEKLKAYEITNERDLVRCRDAERKRNKAR